MTDFKTLFLNVVRAIKKISHISINGDNIFWNTSRNHGDIKPEGAPKNFSVHIFQHKGTIKKPRCCHQKMELKTAKSSFRRTQNKGRINDIFSRKWRILDTSISGNHRAHAFKLRLDNLGALHSENYIYDTEKNGKNLVTVNWEVLVEEFESLNYGKGPWRQSSSLNVINASID